MNWQVEHMKAAQRVHALELEIAELRHHLNEQGKMYCQQAAQVVRLKSALKDLLSYTAQVELTAYGVTEKNVKSRIVSAAEKTLAASDVGGKNE